jgi:uncharacterized protein YheU (UPF0270 family)
MNRNPPFRLASGAPEAQQEPVAIPPAELSAQALRGVIEAFVLREGTDYGEREYSLEQKIAHVAAQIEAGEAQIWFDPNTNSIDITRPAGDGR